MSNFALAFDYDGLPPRVVEELEKVSASLQTWQGKGTADFGKHMSAQQPRCRYVLAAVQSIPASTDTEVVWTGPGHGYGPTAVFDAAQFDNGDDFGPGNFLRTTTGTRLYFPMEGLYLAIAQAQWDGVNDGRRFVKINRSLGNQTAFVGISTIMATAAVNMYQQAMGVIHVPTAAVGLAAWASVVVSHTSATDPIDLDQATIDLVKIS